MAILQSPITDTSGFEPSVPVRPVCFRVRFLARWASSRKSFAAATRSSSTTSSSWPDASARRKSRVNSTVTGARSIEASAARRVRRAERFLQRARARGMLIGVQRVEGLGRGMRVKPGICDRPEPSRSNSGSDSESGRCSEARTRLIADAAHVRRFSESPSPLSPAAGNLWLNLPTSQRKARIL